MFFLRFEYHVFYVLYPFVTCLLTLPRVTTACCASVSARARRHPASATATLPNAYVLPFRQQVQLLAGSGLASSDNGRSAFPNPAGRPNYKFFNIMRHCRTFPPQNGLWTADNCVCGFLDFLVDSPLPTFSTLAPWSTIRLAKRTVALSSRIQRRVVR
jgi:hypothetical protein